MITVILSDVTCLLRILCGPTLNQYIKQNKFWSKPIIAFPSFAQVGIHSLFQAMKRVRIYKLINLELNIDSHIDFITLFMIVI